MHAQQVRWHDCSGWNLLQDHALVTINNLICLLIACWFNSVPNLFLYLGQSSLSLSPLFKGSVHRHSSSFFRFNSVVQTIGRWKELDHTAPSHTKHFSRYQFILQEPTSIFNLASIQEDYCYVHTLGKAVNKPLDQQFSCTHHYISNNTGWFFIVYLSHIVHLHSGSAYALIKLYPAL